MLPVSTLAPPGDSGMVGGSNPDLTNAQIDELQKALPKCNIVHNAKFTTRRSNHSFP